MEYAPLVRRIEPGGRFLRLSSDLPSEFQEDMRARFAKAMAPIADIGCDWRTL